MEGKEYAAFSKFLQTHAITHQLRCPYTHEQNGYAKRKHRHIIEMGLSLLAKASMHLKFWGEAFQIAFYLINKFSTPTLHKSTPLSLLFQRSPNYHDHKIFGCSCYPYLRPYNKHKIQYRSTQCVFLGYSSKNKGYLCLASTTKTYITSPLTTISSTMSIRVVVQFVPNSFEEVYAIVKDSNLLVDAQTEPKTVKVALCTPHWREAMQQEYDTFLKTKTWSFIPLPLGRKAIRCKWVFKVKSVNEISGNTPCLLKSMMSYLFALMEKLLNLDIPISNICQRKNLWGHVDGNAPTPNRDQDNIAHAKWEVKDAQASSPISCIETMYHHWMHVSMIYCMKNNAFLSSPSLKSVTPQFLFYGRGCHKEQKSSNVPMAYVQFGHYASIYSKKICNYCKKDGHIINEFLTRSTRRTTTIFTTTVNSSMPSSFPNPTPIQQNAPTNVSILTPKMHPLLWDSQDQHSRKMIVKRPKHLGHPNSNVLHDMLKSGFLGNKHTPSLNTVHFDCISSNHDKSKILPFPTHHLHVTKPFDIIRMYKYFVTFIDDYSHFTLVYILLLKDEVFSTFKFFYVYF
ncbi:hypothetical protein CR513_38779, partial [Mucuna pruriens]